MKEIIEAFKIYKHKMNILYGVTLRESNKLQRLATACETVQEECYIVADNLTDFYLSYKSLAKPPA